MSRTARIKELERQIEELKSRWPAHSVSAAMIQQLEDLEEELERVSRGQDRDEDLARMQ